MPFGSRNNIIYYYFYISNCTCLGDQKHRKTCRDCNLAISRVASSRHLLLVAPLGCISWGRFLGVFCAEEGNKKRKKDSAGNKLRGRGERLSAAVAHAASAPPPPQRGDAVTTAERPEQTSNADLHPQSLAEACTRTASGQASSPLIRHVTISLSSSFVTPIAQRTTMSWLAITSKISRRTFYYWFMQCMWNGQIWLKNSS